MAGLVGIACCSHSLYEQFVSHEPGGILGRRAKSFGKSGDKVGLADAPRFFAEIAALPSWWGRPSVSRAFLPGVPVPSFGASIAALAIVDARATPPGTRRVAFVDAVTDSEADELAALKDELTPVINEGSLALTGPHALSDAQLRDADYLFNSGALVDLVACDLVDVPARWSAALRRYADLQHQSDRLTVAVFAERLEGT